MTDIKARLEHLAELTKGPELIWPDASDVAKVALARIRELEPHVRFYERKAVDPVPHNKRSPMEHERDEE